MAQENKYKDFEEADFLTDEYFQDWVFSPNESSKHFWQEYLAANPAKTRSIEQAAKILSSIGFKESWPTEEVVESSLNMALREMEKPSSLVVDLNLHHKRGKSNITRWWMAAAAVLFIAFASYFLFSSQPATTLAKKAIAENKQVADIGPGGAKAVLTLADGRQISLDAAGTGLLAQQGKTEVNKTGDGAIVYNIPEGKEDKTERFNTIATPRGGQYQLVLADGSKVWLNAASSLRFPTSFVGSQRIVQLTGEAYFEIAADKQKGFKVQLAGGTEVDVFGTHFNVNSYTDEEMLQTTLLEGSVRVSKIAQKLFLKPGQQANVSGNKFTLIKSANLDEVMAWKWGYFSFHNAGLQTIMRQLSRWYDVDVVYAGAVPQVQFSGELGRSLNLSQVLSALTEMGIKFKIEGKKLVIIS